MISKATLKERLSDTGIVENDNEYPLFVTYDEPDPIIPFFVKFVFVIAAVVGIVYIAAGSEKVYVSTCYDSNGKMIYKHESTKWYGVDQISETLFRTPDKKVMSGVCDTRSYNRKTR